MFIPHSRDDIDYQFKEVCKRTDKKSIYKDKIFFRCLDFQILWILIYSTKKIRIIDSNSAVFHSDVIKRIPSFTIFLFQKELR